STWRCSTGSSPTAGRPSWSRSPTDLSSETLGLSGRLPPALSPCRRSPAAVIFSCMSEVTRILSAIEQGDPSAAAQLLPLVYDELRQLAAQKLAQEKPGQTLEATALVHEAYLRLVDVYQAQHWDSRRHFFAAAAEAMRRILVENARRKRTVKHGGQCVRVDLDEGLVVEDEPREGLLELDEVLEQLSGADPRAAELVRLRFFGG